MVEGNVATFLALYSLLMLRQPNYTAFAKFYDFFELEGTTETTELNVFLSEIFKKNKVRSVLDFACGTGAQSIGLSRNGFDVTASDLDEAMIKIASQKAKKEKLKIRFQQGNMKNVKYGSFDAAICMFNAIGHLTRLDCSKFFQNAYKSLNKGGIFVFDILNFTALKTDVFELYKHIDEETEIDGWLVKRVRDCSLNRRLRQVRVKSYTAWNNTIHFDSLTEDWQMQIYDKEELTKMLDYSGFSKFDFYDQNGASFKEKQSGSIMVVCCK